MHILFPKIVENEDHRKYFKFTGGGEGWITTGTNTQEILLLKEQENISSVFILRVMATGSTY